jgi:L-fuconolactonase
MRVDAHQHYWKVARGDYDWMAAPGAAPMRRDYLPAELEPLLSRHGFDGSVVVQAASTTAETDYLLELAQTHGTICGVVGWLDLEAPDFRETLHRYAASPKFLGIRPMLQDLPDDRYVLRPLVMQNLRLLAEAGRALDLLITPRHLPHAVQALRELSPLRVVVDHCAKPNLREGSLSGWRIGLERLAELPNVVCKLSGLVTEAARADRDALAPAVEHALATFGQDRLLFGSDWPVCTLAASYDRVVELVHETLGARLTSDFERKLFGENARGFYRL